MKKIITISREFGAGGGEIGRKVAERLGYHYYDKELILRSADTSKVDVESMRRWDEKVPANFGFAQSLFNFYNKPLNETLFEAQTKVIREIGEKGNCVIVGRNAQGKTNILEAIYLSGTTKSHRSSVDKEFDGGLHIFVHASPYWRMMRMKDKMPDATEAKISDEIRSIDKTRKKYCSYYTNTEFGVADYYDLCLSTSTLGIDTCVDLICDLAQK